MFSLAVENNRLPVALSLHPALFFVAGDTVFLFFREKKYGVAKGNRCEHNVVRPHFSFSDARKRKTAAPGEKEKGAGCELVGTAAPAAFAVNRNFVQRLQRGHGFLLLFVLSSSACRNFKNSTQRASPEQTSHGTRPFAPSCTMFSLAVENNRLPVVLGLQPALFFVAGDTVFLFFREKKYGVAKGWSQTQKPPRKRFAFGAEHRAS